jgi:hypothetical protein
LTNRLAKRRSAVARGNLSTGSHPDAHVADVPTKVGAVEPDRVFIRKIDDLRDRSDQGKLATATDPEYEILMTAPLLRELLMGEPPLMHTVNRDRRVKIRFKVVGRSAYDEAVLADRPLMFAVADGL